MKWGLVVRRSLMQVGRPEEIFCQPAMLDLVRSASNAAEQIN